MWCAENRPRVRLQYPDLDGTAITTILAGEWNILPDDARAPFVQKYKQMEAGSCKERRLKSKEMQLRQQLLQQGQQQQHSHIPSSLPNELFLNRAPRRQRSRATTTPTSVDRHSSISSQQSTIAACHVQSPLSVYSQISEDYSSSVQDLLANSGNLSIFGDWRLTEEVGEKGDTDFAQAHDDAILNALLMNWDEPFADMSAGDPGLPEL
jgi:hypothetical protein